MRFTSRFVLSAVLAVVGCGVGQPPEPFVEASSDTVNLYAVNYPLGFFAERIGGQHVEVHLPTPANEDPAYWSPDAETIASFQRADLILLNGAGYAKWVDRAALPASRTVDTSAAFSERYIPLEDQVTHSHGPEGAHEHGGYAFTTWLDPTLAIEQARAIHEALAAARPDLSAEFERGFVALVSDLSALDQRLAAAAATIDDEALVFSHPVYQYLMARYALDGRSVHWEPDVEPDLAELEHLLEEQEVRWVIWEGEPLPDTSTRLEEYGVTSVVFEPCGNIPESGDFMTVMATNAAALEQIAGR